MADEHDEIQLARELRDGRIRELHAAGWSQRAIKEEVGCSLGLVIEHMYDSSDRRHHPAPTQPPPVDKVSTVDNSS